MEIFFFGLCCALVVFLVLAGLSKRGGYLELPFLIALTIGGWFLPQVLPLLADRHLPQGADRKSVV